MRHPITHQFLKWAPTAVGTGAVAIAAVWSEAKDWIAVQAVWAWGQMSNPWISLTVIVAVSAYVWGIIWTGQSSKRKPGIALVGYGLHHVTVKPASANHGQYEPRLFHIGRHRETPGLIGWVIEKIRNFFTKELQTDTKFCTSLGMDVDRAKPVALAPDITFKDALRHFAYRSRWAHDYQHPSSTTLVGEFWPQTVYRVFCQSLIDGNLIAWGVRREDGKAPENGSTKIPADLWRTLQFDVHNTLESPDMLGWARDWKEGISYSRVMFNRAQVEDTWPSAESGSVSVIEIAAREWWRLREIEAALAKEQISEQGEGGSPRANR